LTGVAWLIRNIPVLGKLQEPENDLTLLRLDEINIVGDNGIEDATILVRLQDELVTEDGLELLTHLLKLLDLELWRDMDYRIERLVHVLRRTELFNIIEPTLDLVAHRCGDIIAGNLPLIIDE
jgi:hypothetical protein